LWESFKKWWATKPWTRVIPFAPAFSFGAAREWFDVQKESVIKTTTGLIKKLSLPMFLGIVILVLILIFWSRIQKILK